MGPEAGLAPGLSFGSGGGFGLGSNFGRLCLPLTLCCKSPITRQGMVFFPEAPQLGLLGAKEAPDRDPFSTLSQDNRAHAKQVIVPDIPGNEGEDNMVWNIEEIIGGGLA